MNKNFIPQNRGATVIERHALIVLKPLIVGILCVVAHIFLQDNGVHFAKHSENPIIFVLIPVVGFFYVIVAGVAIESVFSEYKAVSRCVIERNKEEFLKHRDEQLPILIHLLLAFPSIILILSTTLLHYEDDLIAWFVVFCVSFIVTITWTVVTELDNFERSIWFKEKIPQEWLRTSVEEYFADKNKSNEEHGLQRFYIAVFLVKKYKRIKNSE